MGGPTPEEIARQVAILRARRQAGLPLRPPDPEAGLDAAEDEWDVWRRRALAAEADNAALRATLSRLAACAFGPPGELLAADAARELLGE